MGVRGDKMAVGRKQVLQEFPRFGARRAAVQFHVQWEHEEHDDHQVAHISVHGRFHFFFCVTYAQRKKKEAFSLFLLRPLFGLLARSVPAVDGLDTGNGRFVLGHGVVVYTSPKKKNCRQFAVDQGFLWTKTYPTGASIEKQKEKIIKRSFYHGRATHAKGGVRQENVPLGCWRRRENAHGPHVADAEDAPRPPHARPTR